MGASLPVGLISALPPGGSRVRYWGPPCLPGDCTTGEHCGIVLLCLPGDCTTGEHRGIVPLCLPGDCTTGEHRGIVLLCLPGDCTTGEHRGIVLLCWGTPVANPGMKAKVTPTPSESWDMMFPVSCSAAARCTQHFMMFPVSRSAAARCTQHFMMFPVSRGVARRCKQRLIILFVLCSAAEHIPTRI